MFGANVQVYHPLNHALSANFVLNLQLHNSPVNCAEELFKLSKDSAGLLVCNEKKVFGFGFQVFCG